jgi:hypothetical protein
MTLLLLAAVYPLLVGRLWWAGRLSDRAATIAAIIWAPVFVLLYGVITAAEPVVLALALALLLAPGILLYRRLLGFVQGVDR